MNTMLRILIEKVDSIQEQMSNTSKEVETLRRSQKRSVKNLSNFCAILTRYVKNTEIKIHIKVNILIVCPLCFCLIVLVRHLNISSGLFKAETTD